MTCSCIFCSSSGEVAQAVARYQAGIYPGTAPYEQRKTEIRFWSRRFARRARGED
jgi:alkanesulfonate monooxygenase SsuD/methylene tetrahydromethanopterin reductase-like flavin-dependent oxidoreductase (luciferase family)